MVSCHQLWNEYNYFLDICKTNFCRFHWTSSCLFSMSRVWQWSTYQQPHSPKPWIGCMRIFFRYNTCVLCIKIRKRKEKKIYVAFSFCFFHGNVIEIITSQLFWNFLFNHDSIFMIYAVHWARHFVGVQWQFYAAAWRELGFHAAADVSSSQSSERNCLAFRQLHDERSNVREHKDISLLIRDLQDSPPVVM